LSFSLTWDNFTVDSNFLRAVHQFKMDLIPALERTLQGKVKPCKLSEKLPKSITVT
jgi:hypothetical protein